MTRWPPAGMYSEASFRREARHVLGRLAGCASLDQARLSMASWLWEREYSPGGEQKVMPDEDFRTRDCARALTGMIKPSADERAGFSLIQALWDLARGRARTELQPGFFAEMIHLVRALEGRAALPEQQQGVVPAENGGRQAAVLRSDHLDELWRAAERRMERYTDGLEPEIIELRRARKDRILRALGGSERDWDDWHWHVGHTLTDAERLARVIGMSEEQKRVIARARASRLPVGVTPFYASLMDDEPSGRDRAVRAQVLPPASYVEGMERHREDRSHAFDFMGEHDTSPIDLITRRYPSILILKPYNTCPQICVYCQRNWEIEEAMAPGALAPREKIEQAIAWIRAHPAIREVLVTGGDPLTLGDERLRGILDQVASIERVDVIRIGSRIPVTVPMRITPSLADYLGSLRAPGRRDVCLVTHVEHPYEINPDMVAAVDRLKRRGISVYNQQVFTFFVSRRFESTRLRLLLRRVGIDPYYTFMTKGKEETAAYRVPLARLLQEQKEEARLLPGSRRTDEAVFNVPRLGKNHIRAFQHRDLLSISPQGERIYEWHPWEKNVMQQEGYVGADVPILGYLRALAGIGEDPEEYQSIWYYY